MVIIFIILLFGVNIYFWKLKNENFKLSLFFTLLIILGFGLHIQIFPLDMTVAPRWFYFTLLGVSGLFGVILSSISGHLSQKYKLIGALLVTSLIIALGVRTIIRNSDWKTPLNLYSADIKFSSSSFDLETNLGSELFFAGRKEGAKIHFIKSVDLAPNYWLNWNNLGTYYADAGDWGNATKSYKKAISNNPNYSKAYEGYAKLLLANSASDVTETEEFLKDSLSRFPTNGLLWFYESVFKYKQDKMPEALEAAKKAYLLQPNQQTKYIYYNLSNVLPLEFE